MLKQNHAEYTRNKTRGMPRQGAALLQGIVFCGACGHKMTVQYKCGNRYLCNYLRSQYRIPVCQHIPADPVDKLVVNAFFEALTPIELDAYEASVRERDLEQEMLLKAHQQKLERLRYQAQLAESQFNQVDPKNRLVAAELEKRWEQALLALRAEEKITAEKSQTKYRLEISDEIRFAFKNIGKKLPTIWDKPELSRKQRKEFLRCLIDKVVVHREKRDSLSVRIVWKGGETTTVSLNITVGSFKELSASKEMENQIIILTSVRDKKIV